MTSRSITIRIKIDGEPQPFPKKRTNKKTGMIYSYDPDGSKAAWANAIKKAANIIVRLDASERYSLWRNLPVFKRPTAVSIEIWVYRTKPKSNKLRYPTGRPDLDNLCYTPHNVLQGIIYDDDSQIISQEEHKRWAGLPGPGMIITVTEVGGE